MAISVEQKYVQQAIDKCLRAGYSREVAQLAVNQLLRNGRPRLGGMHPGLALVSLVLETAEELGTKE